VLQCSLGPSNGVLQIWPANPCPAELTVRAPLQPEIPIQPRAHRAHLQFELHVEIVIFGCFCAPTKPRGSISSMST
jgi:hypothetical protein